MYIAEVLVGKKITLNIPVLMTIGYVVFFAGIGAYAFFGMQLLNL